MDNTQIQSQYPAPKCEVFEVELEDFMKQTSYHYMGAPEYGCHRSHWTFLCARTDF